MIYILNYGILIFILFINNNFLTVNYYFNKFNKIERYNLYLTENIIFLFYSFYFLFQFTN